MAAGGVPAIGVAAGGDRTVRRAGAGEAAALPGDAARRVGQPRAMALCVAHPPARRVRRVLAPAARLGDVAHLRSLGNEALHDLGRIPYPLRIRRGERGFTRLSWDEAARAVAAGLASTDGERMGFFVTSRGLTNEAYYAIQKLA